MRESEKAQISALPSPLWPGRALMSTVLWAEALQQVQPQSCPSPVRPDDPLCLQNSEGISESTPPQTHCHTLLSLL